MSSITLDSPSIATRGDSHDHIPSGIDIPSYFCNPKRFEFDADHLENLVAKWHELDTASILPNWGIHARITEEKTRCSLGPFSARLPLSYNLARTIGNSIFWKSPESARAIVESIQRKLQSQSFHKIHLHYFRQSYPGAFEDLENHLSKTSLPFIVSRGMPLYRCELASPDQSPPSRRLKSKTRNTLSRKRKKLESEHGKVEVKRFTQREEANAFFTAIEQLSPQTWQRHSGMGGLRDNKRFRSVFGHECDANRMLSYILFAGNRPIAYQFGTVYNGIYHYEILGFDSSFSDYSPGQILRLDTFDEFHRDGLKFIDFGPGEYEYKSQWGTESHELFEIRIYGNSIKSKLLWLLESLEASLVKTIKRFRSSN